MRVLGLSSCFLFLCVSQAAEPLFEAIRRADTAGVKRLLDRGANADARDADGTPALLAATLFANPDCVKILLDRGADPNATSKAGATALMWAVPDLEKTKLLLGRGAAVNAKSTNRGRTALLIAAGYPGSVDVLRLLLEKGADLQVKERNGEHALN